MCPGLVSGRWGRNDVRSFSNDGHFIVRMTVLFHSRRLLALDMHAEFRWARNEEHVKVSDIVNIVNLLMLDFRSIEKVDVTPFDSP